MLPLLIALIGVGAIVATVILPASKYWVTLALVGVQVAIGIVANEASLLLTVIVIIGVLFTAVIAVGHFCIDKDAERTT